MLKILIIICYSISLVVPLVLCITLLIKLFRSITENKYLKTKKLIEKFVDDFVLGIIDTASFKKQLTNRFIEEVAVTLLLERLEVLSDKEARTITEFINTTHCIQKHASHLTSSNKWKRAEAAIFLGKTRSRLFLDKLIPLLNDKKDMVIISAAHALAKIAETKAIPELIKAIDNINRVKAHSIVDCIIELCSHNPSHGVPYISNLLNSPKDHLRYWGCVILGELRSFDALNTMQSMVKDISSRVRSAAVEAMGKIGDPASYEHVSLALLDPEWQVRFKATWALGELKYTGAVPALSRALMDRQWEVNNQAVYSLIAVDKSLKSFINLLDSDFPFIRLRAAESLEITGFIDRTIDEIGRQLSKEERKKKMDILLTCAQNGAHIPFYNNINNKNKYIRNSAKQIVHSIESHA